MSQLVEWLEPRRLFAAGDHDLSYGVNGSLGLRFGGTEYQFLPGSDPFGAATIVSISPDKRSFSLRKYNAGMPDTAAGSDGTIATIPFPFSRPMDQVAPDRVWDLSGGRRLIEFIVPRPGSASDLGYFVRLNPDNTLDTTFGAGCAVLFEGRFPFEVVQQGDNLLAINGHQVVRYTDDLNLDTTFGTMGGATPVGDRLDKIAVHPSGRILVSRGNADLVYALTPDGQIDTTFGEGDGRVGAPDINVVTGMVVDSAGRIVVTGGTGIVRFTPDGMLDTTFGAGGVSRAPDSAGAVVLADGRIAGGHSQFLSVLGMIRIDGAGAYDADFGRVIVQLAPPRLVGDDRIDAAPAVPEVQPDGSILVSQRYDDGRFRRVRLKAGGSDPSPIVLNGETLTVTGTPGHDRIVIDHDTPFAAINEVGRGFAYGSARSFAADGGAGHDLITFILLGVSTFGRSTLNGGAGDDRVVGGSGDDTITGGDGYDHLDGGDGNDLLTGGDGRDWIRGQAGNDTISGDAWGDFLDGGAGDDMLDGGGYPDRLTGGPGADTLRGGLGNDLFFSNDDGIDHLFGDAGPDQADADEDDVLTSIETT